MTGSHKTGLGQAPVAHATGRIQQSTPGHVDVGGNATAGQLATLGSEPDRPAASPRELPRWRPGSRQSEATGNTGDSSGGLTPAKPLIQGHSVNKAKEPLKLDRNQLR
jgi:hypothetical protein